MKDKTTASKMRRHFSAVCEIIGNMQKDINDLIVKYGTDDIRNAEMYNTRTLHEVRTKKRAETVGKIQKLKEKAILDVDAHFLNLQNILSEWVVQPIPDSALHLLNAYTAYDLKPSLEELNLLDQTISGNFLASKILSGLAAKNGYADIVFKDLKDLQKDLASARAWAISAIQNFQGAVRSDDDKKGVQTIASMYKIDIPVQNDFFVVQSADFLTAEKNPFKDAEKYFCEITESDFDIHPSRREELDHYFARAADEERKIEMAIALLKSDNSLKELLRVYDSALFTSANDRIVTAWRDDVKDAESRYKTALNNLSDTLKSKPA